MTHVRSATRRGGLISAGGLLATGALLLAAGSVASDSVESGDLATASVDAASDVRTEPAVAARKPKGPSISGSGHLYLGDEQDRYFRFRASGLAVTGYPDEGVPGTTGRFQVAHYTDESHRSGTRYSGHIDCLIVGGRTATFTGVVDRAISFGEGAPDVSDLVGVRRGFSVYDAGRGGSDRLGYSWILNAGSTTSSQKCQGPAPFAYVDAGGYNVTEWLPAQMIPPRR